MELLYLEYYQECFDNTRIKMLLFGIVIIEFKTLLLLEDDQLIFK